MTFTDIYNELKKEISPKRFTHICGVVEAAESLAALYGAPVEQARLAALLHDCAKEMPLKEMQALVNCYTQEADADMLKNGALLHGLAGAILAHVRFGITDEEILEAIRVHTTGKIHMSLLDKIVFLADYIEVNRNFDGVDALRNLAYVDLDMAVLAAYDNTIQHLIAQGQTIYFKTILGRNDMIARKSL